MERLDEIKEDHNDKLVIEGIINQFQSRAKLPREIVEGIKQDGFPVLEPYISTSVNIRESHQLKKTTGVYGCQTQGISGNRAAV